MTIHEQRMCEAQADYFELSIERTNCSSSFFIAKFMNSEIADELDEVDDEYNYFSPNNLMSIMTNNYPSLLKNKGNKYPKKVARWIGYTYRAWSIISKRRSSKIYKLMKATQLFELYDVYHTFSPEYCVERLEELINENKPQKSDYEVYKEIVSR